MTEVDFEVQDNCVYAEIRTGRRIRNGRVEIRYKCPNLCHGFGTCSYCHGHTEIWVKPSPNPVYRGMLVRG